MAILPCTVAGLAQLFEVIMIGLPDVPVRLIVALWTLQMPVRPAIPARNKRGEKRIHIRTCTTVEEICSAYNQTEARLAWEVTGPRIF